jgi:predicted esterase
MGQLRVQFIHGLEGSPQGAKARLLARHFETLTPAMDTSDFEACVAVQANALGGFRPDVLVGSSFGAAVAVELLQRGLWRGATLLLAQAALRRSARAELPPGVPVWLVHGLRDELIDIEESRRLAATGSPEWVVLYEVDDDHPLHETVRSGRLVELVRALAGRASEIKEAGSGGTLPSSP